MKNYTLEELRNDLDRILRDAVVADEAAKIQIGNNLNAVIISEAEWNIMRESFAMLIGGKLIGGNKK